MVFQGSYKVTQPKLVENLKDSAMKSVVTLQKLHKRVKTHPTRVIAEFERKILEELRVPRKPNRP